MAKLFKSKGIMTRGFFIIGFPEETEDTIKETLKMIEDLDLDLINVSNLIPFPGTKVFKQCIDEKILMGNIDINNLWKGEFSLDTTVGNTFYIKPSNISMEKLNYYRKIFDELISVKKINLLKKWKIE